jgi:hypothetical protein
MTVLSSNAYNNNNNNSGLIERHFPEFNSADIYIYIAELQFECQFKQMSLELSLKAVNGYMRYMWHCITD